MTDEAETERKLLIDNRRERGGPSTTVLRAIQRMPDDEKLFLRKVGLALAGFCVVVPVLAEVGLQIVQPDGPGLWWGLWAFCVVGFLAGLCFMSQAIGMWILTRVSNFAERIIPATLKAKFPARSE